MAIFIKDTYSYDSNQVSSFFATDGVSAVLLSALVVRDLIKKRHTDTLCVSFDCRKDVIANLIYEEGEVAKAYIINQRSSDCDKVIGRILRYIRRSSVKAIVLSRADILFKKNEHSSINQKLAKLAAQESVPVILIESYEIVFWIEGNDGRKLSCRANNW